MRLWVDVLKKDEMRKHGGLWVVGNFRAVKIQKKDKLEFCLTTAREWEWETITGEEGVLATDIAKDILKMWLDGKKKPFILLSQ